MRNSNTDSIWTRPFSVALLALTAALLWGWAYPLIKLGFAEFGISGEMTGSKMLFAGVRFTVSGLIILLIARLKGLDFALRSGRDWLYILAFALVNTTLHYTFFYIGLSYSDGSRSAILNSLSTFCTVILACVFFKSDRFDVWKVSGVLLGIAGMLTLNLSSDIRANVSVIGDTLIILNALCGSAASLMTRGLARRINIFAGTGYGLALGGLLLVFLGLAVGGAPSADAISNVSIYGWLILLGLIVISTVGFTLYNKLLTCNPVGKVAIYNSLIPVVGALTSCLCLSEPFHWSYILSCILAAGGIFLINRSK